MRIGIVTEYYYPTLGGIQEHVHHFARQARRVGHDVRILTPEVRDRLASVSDGAAPAARGRLDLEDDQQVIRVGVSVPLLSGGSIARMSTGADLSGRMRDILRAERFDVVHVHSPLMPTLPLLALRSSDALNVGTFHSAFDRSVLCRAAAAAVAALPRSAAGGGRRLRDRAGRRPALLPGALAGDSQRRRRRLVRRQPAAAGVRRRPPEPAPRGALRSAQRRRSGDPGLDRGAPPGHRGAAHPGGGWPAAGAVRGDGPGGAARRRPLRRVRPERRAGLATTPRGTCCSARRSAARSASSRSRRWPPAARWWRPTRPGFRNVVRDGVDGVLIHGRRRRRSDVAQAGRAPPTVCSATSRRGAAWWRPAGGAPPPSTGRDHRAGAGAVRRLRGEAVPPARGRGAHDPQDLEGAAAPKALALLALCAGLRDRLARAPVPVGRRGDLLRGGARDAPRPRPLPGHRRPQAAAHLRHLRGGPGRRRRPTACGSCTF